MPAVSDVRYTGSYRMPRLQHATVADVMHPGVLTCRPETRVRDVARMMSSHHIHSVAVMGLSGDGGGEHLSWRIVSDLDLVRAGTTSEDETASSVAVTPMITVEPGMALTEAAELMIAKNTHHCVVVEPRSQHPVGVLSALDIVGALAWGEV